MDKLIELIPWFIGILVSILSYVAGRSKQYNEIVNAQQTTIMQMNDDIKKILKELSEARDTIILLEEQISKLKRR